MSKILVIDDDGTVRAVLGAMLGKFGHEAILASNALDGIAAAESGSIDVVLIDMNMPGLDGLEAVKAIAHLGPRIPIIGMSAGSATTSVEDYAVLAANLGAALFLPKPFDGTDLQGAIRQAVSRHGGPAAGFAVALGRLPAPPGSSSPPVLAGGRLSSRSLHITVVQRSELAVVRIAAVFSCDVAPPQGVLLWNVRQPTIASLAPAAS